jgi:hypothetical protein
MNTLLFLGRAVVICVVLTISLAVAEDVGFVTNTQYLGWLNNVLLFLKLR